LLVVQTGVEVFAMLVDMQYIPIKTRIMQPPQDDLFAVLDASLSDVQAGDIVAISSKVISIHEGNCFDLATTDKKALVEEQADLVIKRDYWHSPLTVTRNAFIGTAGVDESNADGFLVPLPVDSFASAKAVQHYLRQRFGLQRVGVLITDSHSTPLRRGAVGVAIGWCGFTPTTNHVGNPDLFGREIKIEVSNLADGLAAGSTIVMGEVAECQPVVIIRGTPDLEFTDRDTKDDLFVPLQEDTFRVLYERFLPPSDA